MLQIVKASAGSGKTFYLVLEYLRLILTTPSGFRHILAITFTNKATAEMKERILNQLGRIAHGEKSQYLEKLVESTGQSEFLLRGKAKTLLEQLLFDFNRFSVSTIDKFTQRILKAFYREMHINPGFQVDTDNELLLTEAVDRLISNAGNNPGMFRWLEAFVEEKIENNKSFTIERDLVSLGSELFREKLQSSIDELSNFVKEGDNSRIYLGVLFSVIRGYEKQLKEKSGEIIKIYSNEGFSREDFRGKSRSIAAVLEKLSEGEQPEDFVRRLNEAASPVNEWVLPKHKRYNELLRLSEESLLPLLVKLRDYAGNEFVNYKTALAIRAEWYTAALMVDLNSEIKSLGREKGVLPLSDSNILLKKVIDGSETPFVYEKAGNTWQHFMLDEFQDTSELQWGNLKPLIGNSLADGRFSLVVGDVKQSIYRWRNSNWNILEQQIQEDFSYFPIDGITLHFNFRSGKNVVDFNNAFFSLLSKKMAEDPKLEKAPEHRKKLLDVYGDIHQISSPGKFPDGFVSIETLDTEEGDFRGLSASRLTNQIKEMYDLGYQPGDMSILVRKNDEGSFLINHFLNVSGLPENEGYNFRIVSGESLLLKSSAAVGLIICLFRHLSDRNNRLYKASLLHLFRTGFENKIPSLETVQPLNYWQLNREFEPEFDEILGQRIQDIEEKSMVSGLDELIIHAGKSFNLFDFPGELPFLQNLADRAAELKKSGMNDIAGFIDWWDEKGINTAINLNDQVEAIRLFTIHKAKGLEFRVVFIPFADWTIVDYGNSTDRKRILWCKPTVPPFNAAPLVPVKFSSGLADTLFKEEYYRELSDVLIDNMNLLYVAFTRAVSILRVNIPLAPAENRTGRLIAGTTAELIRQPGFEISWDEGRNIFSYGTLSSMVHSVEREEVPNRAGWIFNDFSEKLRLRPGSDEFFDRTENGDYRKNKGNTLHAILSEIILNTDVEKVCDRAMARGVLLPGEKEALVSELTEMVRHPLAEEWFSGVWKVLPENDLLTPLEIFRPDRIMISGNRAVVVDYKTGERRDSHLRQVRRYAELLRETGFGDVRGFLWYIRENELVEV